MKKPALASALRQWNGPLTQELILHPGAFGLGQVPARLQPEATTNVVCGFCSTGCGLNVHLQKGGAVNLTPTPDYPVNLGMACPKGWEALTPLASPERATTPLLRNACGELEPLDWDSAMQLFTVRLKAIQDQHGPESIAWLGTGQICTEELAFLGALGKFGMGMLHGDGNTRQCMATAVTAYKQSFGFDAPPFTYADFEESDVLVFVGSNLCIAHPILWQRVLRNRHQPEIIVIDPRKPETAMAATRHYAIKPKSDLKLLYAVAHILIARGWINREYITQHTTGFESFAEFVEAFTPETVAADCGLSVEQIQALAQSIHRGRRVSFWWTMGVNQGHEATRTAQALINLALMTGQIGRPGTGANSITGQCNAMGSRLFSNTTNLLGGRDFLNANDRQKVAETLGIDVGRIPDRNSLAYDQILEGIGRGTIKGLWVIATNPAHSWIHQKSCRDLLARLDFLVVQDMFANTETAQLAHLVLPSAAWGEKEGTFINSERRIGLLKKVARAPGQALSDFNIFRLVAQYWGCSEMFQEWTSPESVFQIMKRLSRGQPCDITGIRDYRMLDECGGIQWPCREESSEFRVPSSGLAGAPLNVEPGTRNSEFKKERRLFSDGVFYHSDGRAKFFYESPRNAGETVDGSYPFVLLTGRGSSAQWHTQTRTSKSAVLRQLYPENIYVEIHPTDARRLGIKVNSQVVVASRRGTLEARAFVTGNVQPGQIFIPMHYEATNRLTFSEFDPYSRQPSYKACAVSVRKRMTNDE